MRRSSAPLPRFDLVWRDCFRLDAAVRLRGWNVTGGRKLTLYPASATRQHHPRWRRSPTATDTSRTARRPPSELWPLSRPTTACTRPTSTASPAGKRRACRRSLCPDAAPEVHRLSKGARADTAALRLFRLVPRKSQLADTSDGEAELPRTLCSWRARGEERLKDPFCEFLKARSV